MARWLKGDAAAVAAAQVYARIVAQARRPAFYMGAGVPDIPEGRFELLALHLFLVLHRLAQERQHAGCVALAQALVDRGVADWDANLREMGAGDLGVGRRVKNLAAAFYGRIAAYEAALADGAGALEAALRLHLYRKASPAAAALAAMAAYVRHCREALTIQSADALAAGALDFPEPRFPPEAGAGAH
jgi:cytochrome b pre-mRNA-processing protein 3